jgi:hypothetical protein
MRFTQARSVRDGDVALQRFFDDGRLVLTNNAAERANKSVAIGRKAWLFCGSDDHAKSTANLFSIILSARLHGLDPEEYCRRSRKRPFQAIDSPSESHFHAALRVTYVNQTDVTDVSRASCYPCSQILPRNRRSSAVGTRVQMAPEYASERRFVASGHCLPCRCLILAS